ncbi:MAG TPA: hypothetical protein VEI97_08165 [bacterium]|nr:hypothetical protein [bacterium]
MTAPRLFDVQAPGWLGVVPALGFVLLLLWEGWAEPCLDAWLRARPDGRRVADRPPG